MAVVQHLSHCFVDNKFPDLSFPTKLNPVTVKHAYKTVTTLTLVSTDNRVRNGWERAPQGKGIPHKSEQTSFQHFSRTYRIYQSPLRGRGSSSFSKHHGLKFYDSDLWFNLWWSLLLRLTKGIKSIPGRSSLRTMSSFIATLT